MPKCNLSSREGWPLTNTETVWGWVGCGKRKGETAQLASLLRGRELLPAPFTPRPRTLPGSEVCYTTHCTDSALKLICDLQGAWNQAWPEVEWAHLVAASRRALPYRTPSENQTKVPFLSVHRLFRAAPGCRLECLGMARENHSTLGL